MMEIMEPRPEEGGVKFDTDKVRTDLFPSHAFLEVSKVLTFGAQKYDDENWRKGMKWKRLTGAALRHIFAWVSGEDKDPETGLSHLAHAACCLVFLITYEETSTGEDDRFTY